MIFENVLMKVTKITISYCIIVEASDMLPGLSGTDYYAA